MNTILNFQSTMPILSPQTPHLLHLQTLLPSGE